MAQQGLDGLADAVVREPPVQGLDEVGRGGVLDLVPGVDRGVPERDEGVRLPGAG